MFDLDASYDVIKQAVEVAGVKCVRADEIIHSGTIDVPMYEHLLNADLVIADLSTNNVNAAFELGVRYGLKPHSAIVLAEELFKNPFDMGHIVIRRYKHLGEEVGFSEAKRLMAELAKAINPILSAPIVDSPVYTYLPKLHPPTLSVDNGAGNFLPAKENTTVQGSVTILAGGDQLSGKDMQDKAIEKINEGEFSSAIEPLTEVSKLRPNDSFVLQQLALSTYKSK